MDTTLTKDERGLVDGVVSYLRHEGRSKTMVPKVQAFLGKVTSRAKKEKIAKIESSVSLTTEEKEGLAKALFHHLGHEVELDCVVKPEIVAGFRIQVADWVVDATLTSKLEQMATVLNQ